MKWLTLPFAILSAAASDALADWPGFRGPSGNGVAAEKSFPLQWGPKKNLAWKQPLPGPGTSSPVVWGDRVFVTCFTGTEAKEIVRHVFCFDRQSGKKLWQKSFPAPLPENDYKAQVRQHGLTSSTPVTDGKMLYVFFGRGGLLALDFDGKVLWKKDLGAAFNVFGSGASPALLGDMLLVNAGVESQQLFALNKATGKVLWKSTIHGFCWSMPVVVDLKGRKEIVLNSGGYLIGYDAKNGKELWTVEVPPGYNSSTPLVRGDMIYVMNQGGGDKEVTAVRVGGNGDATAKHVLWKQTEAGASYCSPLLAGDRLFFFSGFAYSLRTKDGKIMAKKRLEGVRNLYGSPIISGDKIILFTRYNGAYVLSGDDKLTVLSHNQLGDDSAFNASPALVGGQIFMRSDRFLYCIGSGNRGGNPR